MGGFVRDLVIWAWLIPTFEMTRQRTIPLVTVTVSVIDLGLTTTVRYDLLRHQSLLGPVVFRQGDLGGEVRALRRLSRSSRTERL